MADSVRELIMKNIQATLEGVTVDNGFSLTLNAVERVLQRGQSFRPPMALVLEGDDHPIDETQQDAGGVATARTLEMAIGLIVQQDEAEDARSASEVMNELIADVQRAMQVDVQRGTHAIDTNELGVSDIDVVEGQPALRAALSYRIWYRHLRTDPRVEV
jgi:hypothetical protein